MTVNLQDSIPQSQAFDGAAASGKLTIIAIYVTEGKGSPGEDQRALVGMFDTENGNRVQIFDDELSAAIERHYVDLYELVEK